MNSIDYTDQKLYASVGWRMRLTNSFYRLRLTYQRWTLSTTLPRWFDSTCWLYTTVHCCYVFAPNLESFAKWRCIYIQNHTTNNNIRKTRLKACIYFVERKGYSMKFITSRRVLVLLEPKNVSSCCLTCSALELDTKIPSICITQLQTP